MPQKKRKKKMGPNNPKKNKPAQTKNEKKLAFGQQPVVTRMTFNQPRRVDINIFIHGGRIGKPKNQVGHKGPLRHG